MVGMEAVFPSFTSPEVDPLERGRGIGAAWRTQIHTTLTRYDRLFRAHGVTESQSHAWSERAVDRLADWSPGLAGEIAGIATGAELEPWQVGMLTGRTEVLAAARATVMTECSTVVALPVGGPPRTIQTWDWHESLRDSPVVWRYQPRSGHHVHGFTEFGVLGKIGVSSAGLGVHFNLLRHASDHERIGVPVHAVARRILDEATDIDEATEIARSARVSASTVVTVVTFDGERGWVRGLELSPAGVGIVEADVDGVYIHTNHFLAPALADGDIAADERPGTLDRLRYLRAHRARFGDADVTARARAMASHAADGAAVCCHPLPGDPFELRSETLATIGLDIAGHRLIVHRGGPCQVTADGWLEV